MFTSKQNGCGGQRELPFSRRKLPPRHTAPTSFGGLSQKKLRVVGLLRGAVGVQRSRSGSADAGKPFRPQDSRREGTEPSLPRLVVVLLGQIVQRDALCSAVQCDEA